MITLLMTLKLAGVFIAMVLVFGTKKKVSRATWCLVGNLASAVCQYALAPNALPSAAFIVIWTAAQLFGYTSTMAAMQLVPQLAPAETRGFWVGLLNSTGRGAMAVAPLVLSVIYARLQPDDGVSHDPTEYAAAEMACLVACGTVSVVAFLLYLPLRVMMPRPPTASLEEEEEMERYLRMSPKEWSKLPMDLRWSVNAKLHEEGRSVLVLRAALLLTTRHHLRGGGGYGMVWYALRYWEWLAGRSLTLPVFRAGVRGQLAVTLGCCTPGSGGGGGCSCAIPCVLPVPPCSCLLCCRCSCGPCAVRPCANQAQAGGGGGAPPDPPPLPPSDKKFGPNFLPGLRNQKFSSRLRRPQELSTTGGGWTPPSTRPRPTPPHPPSEGALAARRSALEGRAWAIGE